MDILFKCGVLERDGYSVNYGVKVSKVNEHVWKLTPIRYAYKSDDKEKEVHSKVFKDLICQVKDCESFLDHVRMIYEHLEVRENIKATKFEVKVPDFVTPMGTYKFKSYK